jgi:hypothetical protein
MQEAAYKGQMRNRFLLGEWGAYEGLVYPQYDATTHIVDHEQIFRYYEELQIRGFNLQILEAYDHGIAAPACYGLAFNDPYGNVCLLDGFYEKEKTVHELATRIKQIRAQYGLDSDPDVPMRVLADPAIFRRTSGNSRTVGIAVSGLFKDENVRMIRANNDILGGIAKVQSYLAIDEFHLNPFNNQVGAPRLFISSKCEYIDAEITDYYWKKDASGEYEDEPTDRNDHAMDMLKYLLTNRPRIAMRIEKRPPIPPKYMNWREKGTTTKDTRSHRYGR